MEPLILLLLNYILMCAAYPRPFTADNDQFVRITERHCKNVSPDDRLPVNKSRPTKYNISFEINKQDAIVHGTAKIMVTIENPTTTINLHVYKMRIESASIILERVNTSSFDTYSLFGYRYCKRSQILDLKFNKIIPIGVYRLIIDFILPISTRKGIVKYEYKNSGTNFSKKWLIIVQFNEARRVFPCWDEPGIKATFDISVKYPKDFSPFSNMQIITNNCSTITCWTYFKKTPLISPSNVMIALLENNIRFKFHLIAKTDIVWYMSETEMMQNALRTVALVYLYSKLLTDLSYNLLLKRDHISFPSNTTISVGCFGLIMYSEKDVLYNENYDFPGRKNDISQLISHRMTREHFVGMVTGTWWTDLWLGESLSKLYSHYIMSKIFISIELELIQLYDIQIFQQTLHYETNFRMEALSEYNIQATDEIDVVLCSRWYYNKGFALLRMIEHMITRDRFQLAVKEYLNTFQFRSATPDDFWTILQNVLEKKQNQKFRIKEIMDTWLTKKYYPIVQVLRDRKKNIMTYNITGILDMENSTWKVPVTFTFRSFSIGHFVADNILIINSSIGIIELDRNADVVIFNSQSAGYYRVNYDENTWIRIANFLNYDAYDKVHVLNRAQLINDVYYQVTQSNMSPFTFWEIARYLRRSTSYIAWYPMFNILSYMSHIWNSPKARYMKIQIREILEELLQNLGYEENSYEDNMYKTLRLLATRWACKLGDMKCQLTARTKLLGHLLNPEDNK
ncbi:glutamyl aminopeptidase-like [Harpegnathos saltator]|uniref:glutamyl aminopeptidase-like n=1 Tax=Harpegnathos saltator TaxID=610380 RepID=UPI000DBED1B5|nr:glutamyl aminopeptidase-like [Harpegnathos saltator]